MTAVRLRPLAKSDLIERTTYDRNEVDDRLAERFFDTAIATLQTIGERPGGGSLRIGELCEIAGLRVRTVPGFPCGWFYFTQPDRVDVVRLLAFAQDLPAEMNDLDAE